MEYRELVNQCGGKYKRIICHTLSFSSNFRQATSIVEEHFPNVLGSNEIVIENHYLGINASDINFTNGRYTNVKPPFPCGFEAVGLVKTVGDGVKKLRPGDAVATSIYGAFSEYMIIPERGVLKVPHLDPSILPMIVCGSTASIALKKVGNMANAETVLVTAAAGATGQFAVQLAKLAGNHVIGTCSSKKKVEHLKRLGCDRAIDYTTEDVFQVLKTEYPNGIDIFFESVGGKTFDTCVNNIADHGRLIVIGAVSGYQDDSAWITQKVKEKQGSTPLPMKLLAKSASIRGFFLQNYNKDIARHAKKLTNLVEAGLLNPGVDSTSFIGLQGVSDALDYMYERKNIGKVVVSLRSQLKSRL